MASLSTSISGGDFSIGALISGTFGVLHGALPKFLALSAIPLIPNLLLLIFGGAAVAANPSAFTGVAGIASFVSAVLFFMIQGAIIFGAVNEMRGRQFSVGEALSKGLTRFLPLFGVAIVSALAFMVGFALLIVPGLILLCMWYAASAVCVVEHDGVFGSMSRSAALTKGYRWKILALVLIVGIASIIATLAIGGIGRAAGGYYVGTVLTLIVQLYTGAFGSVLVALTYYGLRAIKEGIDIDRIADVFD